MKLSTFDVMYDADELNALSDEARERVLSSADALVKCVAKFGRVKLDYMSEISGRTKDEIIEALAGKAIFQDPRMFINADDWDPYTGWVLASQYLCGNIPEKLTAANLVNAKFGCFYPNIAALEALAPNKVDSMSIHVSLGATWITGEIYEKFIASLLNVGIAHVQVIYNSELAVYRVQVDAKAAKNSLINSGVYDTDDMSAVKIIECTMNAKSAKVYDYKHSIDSRGNSVTEAVLNSEKTKAVQAKQSLIVSKFDEFIHSSKRILDEVCTLYNDRFVGYTFTPFDGSFLEFNDLNPEISLYPHQKNAVARILLSDSNLLLAHDVGAGKTYEMICGVHELYRTGLSTRNMIVVPNGVLESTVMCHKKLYPKDRILVIRPSDFTPAVRREALEKIRDGEYVCVYLAFSSFDMIVMSKNYWISKKARRINELRRAAASAKNKRESNILTSEAERLTKKLSKYMENAQDTPWPTFDELGIETLVVDEAHHYKNIRLASRADSITGFHGNGSKKCIEMYEKSQYVKRLIFATGTPLTNSLADLFVFQMYLQPKELKFRKIDTLDTWVNTFAERESDYEVDVDSRHLILKTRFSRFHNLPELMAMFSNVSDFYHETDRAGLPDFGGYEDVLVPRSEWQKLYIEDLSARADAVHARKVSPKDDNMLKITTDGRLCALDIRLADRELNDESIADSAKTAACADKIMSIYKANPGTSQIVFSDIGTPKDTFNVYDDLKTRLIERGMPEYRIAFIHNAATDSEKIKLFNAVNSGTVSVIVGSTQKLGTGVNVQEHLIALHHLDVPWKPADLIQREGRILRRGNECEQVKIYHYVTRGTFDSFSWQLLEKKAKFLDSFLSGIVTDRDADELDNTVLRYSEIKALAIGNPLIQQRVEVANRLERAKIKLQVRRRDLKNMQEIIEKTPRRISDIDNLIAVTKADIDLYSSNKESIPNDERQSFGEELIDALADNVMSKTERRFDVYQGFDVFIPAGMRSGDEHIIVRSANGGAYTIKIDMSKPNGCSRRIDYMLEHLSDKVYELERKKTTAMSRAEAAKSDFDRGNEFESLVDSLASELASVDELIKKAEEAEKNKEETENDN